MLRAVGKCDREEWVKLNTCKFCVGSHLHSCTGYDCREAVKKAEEYFDRMKEHEMEAEELKKSFEITFEIGHIPTRAWLNIFGLPTSNNWRKMHGGIMDRRCGKKKRCKCKKYRKEKPIAKKRGLKADFAIIDEMHEYKVKREEQDNG